MQVPAGQRWRLLATFNSGFENRDRGGFFANGSSAAPLRDGQGTVIAYKDGRIGVVDWHGGAAPGPDVTLARQNLPLLVQRGRPSPLPANGCSGAPPSEMPSASGARTSAIDRHGNLLYAAAEAQTAGTLAKILMPARFEPLNSTSTPNGRP